MKPSSQVRFAIYDGLVSMCSVKVFHITPIWGYCVVASVVLLVYAYIFQAVLLLGQYFQAK